MDAIERLEKHEKDYVNSAWENYTLKELGNWVYLLSKRAQHRTNKDKIRKDLYDAKNYLAMMEHKLKQQVGFHDIPYEDL